MGLDDDADDQVTAVVPNRMISSRSVAIGCVLQAVIAMVMVASLESPASTQSSTVCECPDTFALINRLNMDEVAITALKQQIPLIQAEEKKRGAPSSWTRRPPPA